MTIEPYLFLAIILCAIGIIGVMTRKNIIFVLMSIELIMNAANLIFVCASKLNQNLDGQIMVFFTITIAACEAAVGLAMVIALFRRYGTIDLEFLRVLRG